MRERMLEVARDLFVKNGYNATTTADIVKRSGSSKGTLYYHFETKENLFLEILNLEEDRWLEVWREEEKKCSSNTAKFHRFNELSAITDAYYPLQMALIEFYSKEHESKLVQEKIDKLDRRYIDQYYEIFKAGNEAGEWNLEDIETTSQIAAATVTGLILFTYKADNDKRKELVARFSHTFLKGLL